MTEPNAKKQLDIRVTRSLDEAMFDYLSSGKGIEKLRELYQENELLKNQNAKLNDEINKHKGEWIGTKLSARQAQKNTDMVLGILNTWLFYQQEMRPISIQEKRHPVLAFFESEHRRMLDEIKQRAVYNDEPKAPLTHQDTTFLDEDNPF